MPALFSTLIDTVQFIGVHEVPKPIDILRAANDLAQHPDANANFEKIVALVDDPKNYFARWTAIRTISVMGPAAIRRASPILRRRLAIEDFDLAKRELENALAKIDKAAT